MIKLKGTTTALLLQLRDEIKSYNYADYQDVFYACVIFLMRGFSVVLQERITDKLMEAFRWGR